MRIGSMLFVVATFQCILFAGTVYNPVSDFNISPGANPDGVWSYGKLSAGGSFTPLGYFDGSGAIAFWENVQGTASNFPAYYPLMAINPTGGAFGEGATFDVPAGSLYLAPGPSVISDWIDLRFTAPATGIYDFIGQFEFLNTGGYTDNAYVLRNGTALINDVLLGNVGAGQTVPINLTGVSLTAGDPMDFAIQAGSFLGDSNALQLNVTQEQTGVPEPSTFGFAALSAACLLIRLRRK
jgi:hypothetical protein